MIWKRGRSEDQKWGCVWWNLFHVIWSLFLFKSMGNKTLYYAAVEQQRLVFCSPHVHRGQQKALLHLILSLGKRVCWSTLCFFENVNLEVAQASLAHISLPKMSHMDTFNFKCNGMADQTWHAWERPHILYWIWKCRKIWKNKCLWYVINEECFKMVNTG